MGQALEIVREKRKQKNNSGFTDLEEIKPVGPMTANGNYGYSQPVWPVIWNGEKNNGQAGPIIKYFTDTYALRARSKQAFLEHEFFQGIVKKRARWDIGSELRLRCEPKMDVVKKTESFNKDMEAFWGVYANSKICDLAGLKTLNELTLEAREETIKAGDMLVVLRVINGLVKIQHIDGAHVMNPLTGVSVNGIDFVLPNGNRIKNGVEKDSNGKHVAYHVRNSLFEYQRILAYEPTTGMRMAYLICGVRESVDSDRGMPLGASVIEMSKKTERYLGYAVEGAAGRQSVGYTFERPEGSSEEDPHVKQRARALRPFPAGGNPNDGLSTDINGFDLTANKVTMGGNTILNMPAGSTLKMHSSDMELNVPEFCTFLYKIISMVFGMPICVALSEYNDSFSASRMAGKDFEHTFLIDRKNFAGQYLDPIYELQLFILVNSNKIQAPGLMEAYKNQDDIFIQAYLFCRWEGDMFPDIDPLKTIKYLREALGTALAHIPLITGENAAAAIGQGGIEAIIQQVGEELIKCEKAKIEPEIDQKLDTSTGGAEVAPNDNIDR